MNITSLKLGFLLALACSACGGSNAQPNTAHSAGEELDWSRGAPEVGGAFTDEQEQRLAICVLVSTTMFSAGESKTRGVTRESFTEELRKKQDDEAVNQFIESFVDATYESDFEDPVEFTYARHATCVEKVAELEGALAERAEFCLGRNLVAVVGYRLRSRHSAKELATRLQLVPGFDKPYLNVGYAGTFPEISYWQECLNGS